MVAAREPPPTQNPAVHRARPSPCRAARSLRRAAPTTLGGPPEPARQALRAPATARAAQVASSPRLRF